MKPVHFWIVLLMFAFSLVNYFGRTIVSVAAPGMMKEFSLSGTQMGLVFAAFQVTYTLFMVPGGRWADRFGPRNVLTVMGLGAGLLTALMSFGAKPGLGSLIGVVPAMIIIRLGFGAFTAPLYPTAGRMIANWIPARQRTRVQALVTCGSGLGAAVSSLVFAAMIGVFGWRMSFVLAGSAAMALALLWLFTIRDRPFKGTMVAELNWRPLLRNGNLRWLVGGYTALNYFEYIFFFWLYYYLGEVRKLPPEDTAFYTAIPFVAWTVMTPLGGWFTDAMVARVGLKGMRSVAIACLLTSVLCLAGALRADETNALVALLSLSFGFCAIADVVFWSATIALFPSQAGGACGLLNTGGNFGGMIAPVLTPIIAQAYGWSAGLYFGGLLALVGLLVWLRIDLSQSDNARGEPLSSDRPE